MVIDVFLPFALAFIMFSLGITLLPADFQRVFSQPRAIGLGLLGQIVLLPLLAFGLLKLSGLSGELAVGVMILAACPGGVSSGLLTRLAHGDTALSISLTAISSVAALLSLPLVLEFSLSHFFGSGTLIEMPVGRTVGGVFLLTALPVGLGMSLRHWRPTLALRLDQPLARLSTLLFLLIVIATFLGQRTVLLENLATLGPLMLALNLLTMAAGYGLSAVGGLMRAGRIAVAMECGLQNAALGIFVASVLLKSPTLAIPSIVYALLMNLGALGVVGYVGRKMTLEPEPKQIRR